MEERYRLRAYLAEGKVHETGDEGFSTFSQVFIRRPDEHRYAIAETTDGKFIAWDLFGTLEGTDSTVRPPNDAVLYDDLDQAVMATGLRYKPHSDD